MRKDKGITLIALVITIIVLLILAGVSIATLTGENGILVSASKSREKMNIEQEREAIMLSVNEAYIDISGKIGKELYDKNIQNSNRWHIFINSEENEIYGTGWNYIEKGIQIGSYGETRKRMASEL